MPRLTFPIALPIAFGIVAVTAAILWAMGRIAICKCGYVQLYGPPDSQHLFDAYSFTHVLHGPVFYLAIWLVDRGRLTVAKRLVIAVLLEGGWEIVENTPFIINRYSGGNPAEYSGDSIVNSVGDLLAAMAGVLIAATLPVWLTVVLFVAAEVTLYIFIQDSLVLNFIGLVFGSRPF
jgi:hypothetical protein